MAKIVVSIDKFGNPTIDAQGFTGAACKKATLSLEKALNAGSAEVKVTNKPEMYAMGLTRVVTNRGN